MYFNCGNGTNKKGIILNRGYKIFQSTTIIFNNYKYVNEYATLSEWNKIANAHRAVYFININKSRYLIKSGRAPEYNELLRQTSSIEMKETKLVPVKHSPNHSNEHVNTNIFFSR